MHDKTTISIEDINDMYQKNKEKWKQNIKESDKNEDYVNDFLSNDVNTSLIYFAEFDELDKLYKEFVEKSNDADNVKNRLVRAKAKDFVNEDIQIDEPQIKPVRQEKAILVKNSPTVGYAKNRQKDNGINKAVGRNGEKIVSNILKNKHPNIRWVSENAKLEGVNPEGSADMGYDMEYTYNNGIRIYVEVKSSQRTDILFHMSANEWRFAKENYDNYEIYFVSNILKEPKISESFHLKIDKAIC